jgi:hypothetical protein
MNEHTQTPESMGRRSLPLRRGLVLAGMVLLACASAVIYRHSQLRGLPDIGHPFDVETLGRVDIDPADNAAADYTLAARLMSEARQPPRERITAVLEALNVHWDLADDDVRHWLEDNRPALERWKLGTAKAVHLTLQPAEMTLEYYSTSVVESRTITELAGLEILRLEAVGELEAAWDWLQALYRYSRHMGMFDTELDRSLGVSAHSYAVAGIVRWAAQEAIDAAQLRQALDALRSDYRMTAHPSVTLRAEYFRKLDELNRLDESREAYATVVDTMDPLFDLLGLPDARPPKRMPGDLELYFANEPEFTRRLLQHQMANLLAYCDLPHEERPPVLDGKLFYFDADDAPERSRLPAATFRKLAQRSRLPQFILFKNGNGGGMLTRERARQGLVEIALAAEWFRRKQGVFPETLDELVAAGVLDAVPLDPWSHASEPLRYARDPFNSRRAKVWSVGYDGVDDGGDIDRDGWRPQDMGYWIGVE